MSKQEEIKQALAAATPGPWEVVNLGDLHIAKGYRKEGSQHVAQWIAEMYFETNQEEDQAFNDAHLIAKTTEYIAYLLAENEQLEKRNQDLDAWATEGFEENQKLVEERDRLRKELEEERKKTEFHRNTAKIYRKATSDIHNTLRWGDSENALERVETIIELAQVQEGEGNQ